MPPPSPRDRPVINHPTWRAILACYAVIAAIPVVLWVVSRPLAGAVVLAAVVGLFVGARRAYGLVRCFRDCRGFAFDVGGKVRVTVAPTPVDDPT